MEVDGSLNLRSNSMGDVGMSGRLARLFERLCKLSAAEFENLLHPVFQEASFEYLRVSLSKNKRSMRNQVSSFLSHPSTIPQDELTLIVAGGVLGALAGFVQMSLGYLGCDELCTA